MEALLPQQKQQQLQQLTRQQPLPERAAASGEVFKIGGIGPVTGAAAVYGLAVKNGAQIAVDEINADGGINGYQIDFQFQDDEHDAEKAVNAYNTLKDWGMQMLMGTVTSAPCVAVADKTMADNMFQDHTGPVLPLSVHRTRTYSAYVSLTRIRVLHPQPHC